uniref:Protein DCL, chloroplastic n=1 Tax=Anthurium amnicola TaxID=1678845 RepID=A0A1D1YKQ1_9ARAE
MEAEKPEEAAASAAVDMELGAVACAGDAPGDGAAEGHATQANGVHEPGEDGVGKRGREDGEEDEEAAKRQRVESSVEEERMESPEEGKEGVDAAGEGVEGREKDGDDGGKVEGISVRLGPKSFGSSVEMFEYFYKLLHTWSPNLGINKYEHMVLLELIKKGHPEPDKKTGDGIDGFQVRYHPLWKSRCFFLVRVDGSSDDFSFRKCVDRILPLPDNMKAQDGKRSGGNQKGGGHGSGGRRGRGGRGGGRGKRGGFRK